MWKVYMWTINSQITLVGEYENEQLAKIAQKQIMDNTIHLHIFTTRVGL